MIYLGLWLLVLGVSAAQAASITQQTEGWCSPAIGQTGGNVTITMTCQGVDPKALEALNRDLGFTKGQLRLTNQQLEQKTKEANEWAHKYRELSQQNQVLNDEKLTQRVKGLLSEGKLEEADTLLRRSAISMAQYQAIQPGMSYPEVVKILGRPGVEGASSASVINYSWRNTDGSIVAVVFTNGQVGAKNQGGLR
jgi:hypothetical protein